MVDGGGIKARVLLPLLLDLAQQLLLPRQLEPPLEHYLKRSIRVRTGPTGSCCSLAHQGVPRGSGGRQLGILRLVWQLCAADAWRRQRGEEVPHSMTMACSSPQHEVGTVSL